jgi:archaellum biogenesis ATPase FlaH
VEKQLPLLERVLERIITLSKRQIRSAERIISGSKRRFYRWNGASCPKASKIKSFEEKILGKEKEARKNTVICDENRRCVCRQPKTGEFMTHLKKLCEFGMVVQIRIGNVYKLHEL